MITQTYDELLALVLRTRKQGVELYDFLVRHFHTDTRTQALKSLLTQEQELLQQASSLYPRDIYQESCQNLQALQNLVPKQYILPDISTLCEEICVHNFDLTQSLYIALGMETSHIHMCDIFLKLQSQKLEQDSYLDMLYRLEALSYNHHIPLLHSLLSWTTKYRTGSRTPTNFYERDSRHRAKTPKQASFSSRIDTIFRKSQFFSCWWGYPGEFLCYHCK